MPRKSANGNGHVRVIESAKDLTPDPLNANRGTDSGKKLLSGSLTKYGAGRSILADRKGIVIAGNKTLQQANDIGLPVRVVQTDGTELVVVQRTDLDIDDAKGRELAYADNRVSQVDLDWNPDQMLADVNRGIDLASLFGKDDLDGILKEADGYGGGAQDDPGADDSRAAELQAKWNTSLGQLWAIGAHRLLVGDCTVRENVERVMGGEKAQMVFTDPPYNVNYGANANPRWRVRVIENDAMSPEAWLQFCDGWMGTIFSMTDGAIYVCMSDKELGTVSTAFAKAGGHWSSYIVWVKDRFVLGLKDYHSRNEKILYGWPEKGQHNFYGGRDKDDVWEVPRPGKSDDHPTMKPVELVERALENSTIQGAVVADPFCGSGTTIVACERLGRQCRAIEISPAYVAVTLERLSGMNLTPVLVP